MRIVFFTPTHQSLARGNTVTVNRWTEGLRSRGHAVLIVENDQIDMARNFAPTILHAHHAVHCGPTALDLSRDLPDAALIVSLGGTDLNGPADGPHEAGRQALEGADAIVGPFATDGVRLREAFPACAPFHVVPRGVASRSTQVHPFGQPLKAAVIGGVRPVKGQLDALTWLAQLVEQGIVINMVFAGPIVDQDYGDRFKQACGAAAHADYLGQLAPAAVETLIQGSDVILNCSLSEGASNVILEALAAGRPVAARCVAGNRELLGPAPPATRHLIQDGAAGLAAWCAWLRELPHHTAETIAHLARDFVYRHHSTQRELDALVRVYGDVSLTPPSKAFP